MTSRNIAVVGSGYMGGGIAQVLALAGARVALADVSAEIAESNYDRLLKESDDIVAARPDAIIGSNTSTISIAKLAEAVSNPERFLGVHFSNPAPFIPGVEVIPHEGTSEATVQAARAIVGETGKETATVKDVTGS